MTDRKSRRVVIINNICSDTIDQAIFILKSNKKDIELSKNGNGDIVREAQEIINSYVRQVEKLRGGVSSGKKKKKNKKITALVLMAMSAVICAISVFVIAGYIIC